MNFLEYVNKNTEGLVFIDKLRSTIKSICSELIKESFEKVTEEDIDKLYLFIEMSFMMNISDDEYDIKFFSIDDVKSMIHSIVSFHHFCNGVEKNKRETYKNVMWDVIYRLVSTSDDDMELCNYSHKISVVYEALAMEESGFENSGYSNITEEQLQDCITDIYKYMLKDKIEI